MQPPRFIERDPPLLHDTSYSRLPLFVQSGSRITTLNVLRQIEVRTTQPRLHVIAERCGDRLVARRVLPAMQEVVEDVRDRAGGCQVGDWRGVGEPDGAGEVEDWGVLVIEVSERYRSDNVLVAVMRKRKAV